MGVASLIHPICSICLAELTHAFGRLNPAHPATEAALASLRSVIHAMPTYRLHEPSTSAWGTAGILAGFLHAYENGYTVLSANMRDFDIFNQLVPDGRILLYQPLPHAK